jgi:dipeptidase
MCDSLVARGARSIDGVTLFAKNSDRRGREVQPFVQFPAAFHARGSSVRCTHITIDQVAETYRIMGHSPAWCWGFEHGVNDSGVAIGNHATWSREPLEAEPGQIGMDLVRLGLERGRNAREALEVIAALVELHGQGGSAFGAEGDDGYQNSFTIADGRSAWVLETTARSWAAREVDGASLTNALTLGGDWQIGSRDLERSALQQGFWTRDARLDFKRAYGLEAWPRYLTERRQAAAADRLAGPSLSVEALTVWLRDHGGEDLPPAASREMDDPTRYSVCMHADPVSTTTASMVGALPEDPEARPWPMWISFATPCTGIFVPVYLDGVIPGCFASAGESDTTTPSLWCSLRDLQEKASEDFARTLPILRAGWSELEMRIEHERLVVEEEAAALYASGEFEKGAALLTQFMTRVGEDVFDASRQFLDLI